MQKTREYVRVLLVLAVVLGLYRLVAVPLLEPPAPPASPIEDVVSQQVEDDPWWSKYFASGAWQTKEPTVIQTEQGVLLFQDWEQITPERLKLWPLTIVIPRDKKSDLADAANEGSVIFIENPEGAEIQFREAIDITGVRPPPVVGGHLSGAIQIISPASKSDGSDELFIQTKNVHIDRRHLWTPSSVHLKLGTSVVEGQDLSIVLDKDLLSQSETKTPVQSVFRGLDHIELRYVDRVHIDLPHGGLWKPKSKPPEKSDAFVLMEDPSKKMLASATKEPPATMDVRCGGAFYFDFHSGWAKMLNSVDVTHQIVGQPLDRFQCYDLEMHFSSAEPETSVVNTNEPKAVQRAIENPCQPGRSTRFELLESRAEIRTFRSGGCDSSRQECRPMPLRVAWRSTSAGVVSVSSISFKRIRRSTPLAFIYSMKACAFGPQASSWKTMHGGQVEIEIEPFKKVNHPILEVSTRPDQGPRNCWRKMVMNGSYPGPLS